jgi:hypothetical protein
VQKLRDQIGLTPRTSSVSTQTMDTAADDGASEPQHKKQKTHELELLRLRF